MKKIRSLQRGLAVLECLNKFGDQTCNEISEATKLSRGTAFRLLLTLEKQGYVHKQGADGRFVLTYRVMALSHGFDLENWPAEAARPIMERLCQEVIWPIGLSTLCGKSAIVRENTDRQSTLVFKNTKGGYAMPLFASAAGWILIAYSGEQVRTAMQDAYERYPEEGDEEIKFGHSRVEEKVKEIRETGYTHFTLSSMRTTALSVPVLRKDGSIIAALSLRFFTSAMDESAAAEKFVPKLQAAAHEISSSYAKWIRKNTVADKRV